MSAPEKYIAAFFKTYSEDEVFEILESLDTQYDAGDSAFNPFSGEEVSNLEYDNIRKEAKKTYPNRASYWDRVTGSSYEHGVTTFRLKYPMVSLEKVVGESRERDFARWVVDIRSQFGPKTAFAWSYKVDGVGVSLEYEKGELIRAGIRPRDGFNSEDRTLNLRMLKDIPVKLPQPVTCTIRGEVFVYKEDFARFNDRLREQGKKTFENERNYTTGSIRQDDPIETSRRHLRFLAHSVMGLQSSFRSETERAMWMRNTLKIPFVSIIPIEPDNLRDIYRIEEDAPSRPLLLDGIVFMINDLETQEQYGSHGDKDTGNPRGKIAWKFRDEEKEGEVKEIVRQVGRTGKITYVAVLKDSLRLEGTTVSRVTLHNLAFIHDNKIDVGTRGMIIKSGKIIPKWVRTVGGEGKYLPDYTCPACKSQTEIIHGSQGKYNEYCPKKTCPSQIIHNFLNYLQVFGVKGIGESTLRILVEKGIVQKPGDFYRLDVPILTDAGLSERESLLAIAAIHKVPNPVRVRENGELSNRITKAMATKKVIPLGVFFGSLGVHGAGQNTGELLARHFGTFEAMMDGTVEEFEKIAGIGKVTADAVFDFFRVNGDTIVDLIKYVEPQAIKNDGPLNGYTFVFSGSMKPYTEGELVARVKEMGASVAGSVSKKMIPKDPGDPRAFLVAGSGSGSKSEAANKLEVPILNVDGLIKLIHLKSE